jgi:hypothetical protein
VWFWNRRSVSWVFFSHSCTVHLDTIKSHLLSNGCTTEYLIVHLLDNKWDLIWSEVSITWVKLGCPTKPRNKMKIQYFWRMTPRRWVTWHCVIPQNTWNITTAADKYENCCTLHPFVQIKGPAEITNYKSWNFTIYNSLTIYREKNSNKQKLWNALLNYSGSVSASVSVIMHIRQAFLGAFLKLWKATISVVISVCLSVRTEQLTSRCTDFRGI